MTSEMDRDIDASFRASATAIAIVRARFMATAGRHNEGRLQFDSPDPHPGSSSLEGKDALSCCS